jgi:hypothetical protein
LQDANHTTASKALQIVSLMPKMRETYRHELRLGNQIESSLGSDPDPPLIVLKRSKHPIMAEGAVDVACVLQVHPLIGLGITDDKSAAVSAHPQPAGAIVQQRRDCRCAHCSILCRGVRLEMPGLRIETQQAFDCANPKLAVRRGRQRPNSQFRHRWRVCGVGGYSRRKRLESPGLREESRQACVVTDPQGSIVGDMQREDGIGTQTAGIARSVSKDLEAITLRVKAIQSAVGAGPQVARRIHRERTDPIVGQASDFARLRPIGAKRESIVAIQAVLRAKP